jgi:L-lactate dehydrogenase complex protein LldE
VGLAAVELLERQGCAVGCPEGQTCCGQPAYNAGCLEDARAMARHTLRVLSRADDPVVTPSGSCAEMIVHRYPELLRDDARYREPARALAARTFELSQFLVERLPAATHGARYPARVAYHASCHLLRGLGVDAAPRKLLAGVAEAEIVPLAGADECCGFGGLFALQMADISGAMLGRKIERILASGAQAVVACDLGCLLQLEGGLRRRASNVRALHLAELLAERE